MQSMNAHASDVAGIRATGLTKSYGPVRAVRGLDVVIAPGETVALLGPNGAGKSTTIVWVPRIPSTQLRRPSGTHG